MTRVFVSSTRLDLAAHRARVIEKLRGAGYDVDPMEQWPAAAADATEVSTQGVEACDVVLLLVAYRRGHVPGGETRSITQLEVAHANARGKPVLAFLLKEDVPWLAKFTDLDRDPGIGAWRTELQARRVVGYFDESPDSIDVLEALRRWEKKGGEPGAAPSDPQIAAALADFAAGGESALDAAASEAIRRHAPSTLAEYRLARFAEWSQPRYALDKRFARMTVLLDRGADAQGERWQAVHTFEDLRDVLCEVAEPAVVLLGAPGSGKSTLLRRMELDLAVSALRSPAEADERRSFFVPLGRYRGDPPPAPGTWLAAEWDRLYPGLEPFEAQVSSGQLTLLLDALNEMPHGSEDDYRARISLWQGWLAELSTRAPGTRVVFSCRSLDYSAPLSTGELRVPHVRIERLSDEQVEAFLAAHDAARGPRLWSQLRGTRQLDLFRSPYYLKLLLESGAEGDLIQDRAALFTAFVRSALLRELEKQNPLLLDEHVLDRPERTRIVNRRWPDPHALPERSALPPALAALAFGLQERRGAAKVSEVRAAYAQALALLGGEHAARLLDAGVALQILERDERSDEVFFVHQLLQEYFAARALAASPRFDLARTPWRAADMTPTLTEELARIGDADLLPPAPTTGWEETYPLAVSMVRERDVFVGWLAEQNLPLAGQCAAGASISPALKARLQQDLVARSRSLEADLRARVAAAHALGVLGDPRFVRQRGPYGEYLLPPLIEIPSGRYTIGSDEGADDERPVHAVELAAFAIAQFPVTNAEWRCFMEAKGYEDERWWSGEAARAWRRGDGVADAPRRQSRANRRFYQRPGHIEQGLKHGYLTSVDAEVWRYLCALSDAEFETLLDGSFEEGRRTAPKCWYYPAFNHPSQPVSGVCVYEVEAYCVWLSAQSGLHFALPSEAQWEAAARGKEARRYAFGDQFSAERCNTFEAHVRGTTPPGVFPAGDTPEGVCDMTGNVWEWLGDDWHANYAGAPIDGRAWIDTESADRRVVRGGCWSGLGSRARSAFRAHFSLGDLDIRLGFRLVRASPSR